MEKLAYLLEDGPQDFALQIKALLCEEINLSPDGALLTQFSICYDMEDHINVDINGIPRRVTIRNTRLTNEIRNLK